MSYRDPEASDPHELVGVVVPGDETSLIEMATAFAEEFARMGWPRERILALFASPRYRAARGALDALGAARVKRIVDDAVALWGGARVVVRDRPGGDPQ